MSHSSRVDRLAGTLLGTALGDALGLPCEGMTARAITRRFGTINRFRLLGSTGYVSDDTELTALVAETLIRHRTDPPACVDEFRRRLIDWLYSCPFGIGRATLGSSLRALVGIRPSGVRSAGNGAAMRSAILGVALSAHPKMRRSLTRALAEVTHRDPRAIEGAAYVAELASACANDSTQSPTQIAILQAEAQATIFDHRLAHAIDMACQLASQRASIEDAARSCGTSGYVVHTLAFATYMLLSHEHDPMLALSQAIAAGGDTDTIAAILGGWLGARHGSAWLPETLIARIDDGPFGPTHLRSLAEALAQSEIEDPIGVKTPTYSQASALARNLKLWPIILTHGVRRLVP